MLKMNFLTLFLREFSADIMFLPAFFGVRVKVPLTVRQWELSPPHTPHLSSTLLEPISLSQPTFWKPRTQLDR